MQSPLRAAGEGGAVVATVSEFVIAIVGTVSEDSKAASYVLIVFVCIFIFFFAS